MTRIVATAGEFATGLAYGLLLAAGWYGLVVACVVGFLNRGDRTGGGRAVWRWHKRVARRAFRGLFERWPGRVAAPVPGWARPAVAWYRDSVEPKRATARSLRQAQTVASAWPTDTARYVPELDGSTAKPVHADRNGWAVKVTLYPGKTGRNLDEMADRLSGAWRARDGSVSVERTGIGGFLLVRRQLRDPLARITPWPGPAVRTIRDPAPLGVHGDGTTLLVPLNRHTMIAGTTDAGKTGVEHVLIGSLLGCYDAEVRLADLKGSPQMRDWRPAVAEFADSVTSTVTLLEKAVEDMDARYRTMDSGDWKPSSDERAIVIVLDEIARLKDSGRAKKALAHLALMGREAWVFVYAATQYPTVVVVDAQVRGQFGNTVGLRLRERAHSTVVFGDGALEDGWDTSRFDAGKAGLLHARSALSPRPKLARSFWMSEAQRRQVAAAHARPDAEPTAPGPTVAVASPDDGLLARVRAAGPAGVQTAEFLAVAEECGLTRRTAERRLEEWGASGRLVKVAHGRWAAT
jgi:hypothetical protein